MSGYFITDGIIIKREHYRENSVMCRCLSKDRGMLTVVASGVHKDKTDFSGHFEPFNYLQLDLSQSRRSQICNVRSSSVVCSLLDGTSYNSNLLIYAAGELVLQIDFPGNDSESYFNLLVDFCTLLPKTGHNKFLVFLRYVLRLLNLLGTPLNSWCSVCSKRVINYYLCREHGFICSNCFGQFPKNSLIAVSKDTVDTFTKISDLNSFDNFVAEKQTIDEITSIILNHFQSCYHKSFQLLSLKNYR